MNKYKRVDHDGKHRAAFDRNKKKILATQDICGICGLPVDKSLKYPHPMAPTVDHIVPIHKNGHPSDISNLQLAHWTCNRQKSDKLAKERANLEGQSATISSRLLPLLADWKNI